MKRSARIIALFLALAVSPSTRAAEMAKVAAVAAEDGQSRAALIASLTRQFVKKPTAEQNIFLQLLDNGQLDKAVFQWPTAFDNTKFGESPSGDALAAFLLYNVGIKLYAIESLVSIGQPQKIAPAIIKEWKKASPSAEFAWALLNPRLWRPGWTTALGQDYESRVLSHQTFQVGQQKELNSLIAKAPADSSEKIWLEWQKVLLDVTSEKDAESDASDAGLAAKKLADLMRAPKSPVSLDLMSLTAARMLYQAGYLDAAIGYYNRVPKNSDDWFDAQEEIAWSDLRKGEPQDAIAVTQTLVTPAFLPLIGPEAVYVRALALLKVCDYPEVAKTLDLYRKFFRARAKSLLELSEQGDSASVKQFVSRARTTASLKMTDLGPELAKLPRYSARDEILARLIQIDRELENEADRLGELYGRSVSEGTAKIGFQGRLEQMRRELESRSRSAKAAVQMRFKTLAQGELDEIAQILQKMHIVEAELIQQVALSGKVARASDSTKNVEKKGTTGSKDPDRIIFPDEGETWFDELSNYQVDLKKGCQVAVKR